MNILVGGDLAPTKSNENLFNVGDINVLFGKELLQCFRNVDYRIMNLETPLTDIDSPIVKHGPALRAPVSTVAGIAELGINACSLANNHIMDHNTQGLLSTIKALTDNGIDCFGVGMDREEATRPYYFELKGITIGVFACAEHEFSIAALNSPGANPFDPLRSLDDIEQVKKDCDLLIVLYHGGKEYYRYPSPLLQQTCRRMVDKGADLVVCQHSHCIGCKEIYKDKTIVYGQGNFLFDCGSDQYQDSSMLISVDENGKCEFLPLIRKDNCVRLATGEDRKEILQAFETRSKQILEPGFIENEYMRFAETKVESYLLCFSGIKDNFILRVINRLTGRKLFPYLAKRVSLKRKISIWNYIACEAHRELLLEGLFSYDKDIDCNTNHHS